jgi:hypothetical protein
MNRESNEFFFRPGLACDETVEAAGATFET